MRAENARMKQFLKSHGLEAQPKRIHDGTLRRTWRLYNHDIPWSEELAAKLGALGFGDYDGKPLHRFSGNGGLFSIFATGHDELADNA